jgi:hypothetical protein
LTSHVGETATIAARAAIVGIIFEPCEPWTSKLANKPRSGGSDRS